MSAPGPSFLPRDVRALVTQGQNRLGMSHARFGEALGSSTRTVARWSAGQSTPSVDQIRALAALVYPLDAALAEQLARATSVTLEELGLRAPQAPPLSALARSAVVDAVVCAAADAMQGAPSVARKALVAAFARASELGVSLADVEAALTAAKTPLEPAPAPKA
jgi:hypothetical protein